LSLLQLINIKTKLNSIRSGYVFILVAAALTGLIHSLSKPLLSYSTPSGIELNPLTLAAIIYLINGAFFTPMRKDSEPIRKIGKKNLIIITLIGLAEVSGLVAYFFGLKESTAVNASILTNGEIIFSVLIALMVFRERLHRKEVLPFLAIIMGIIFLPIGYELIQSKMTITDLLFGNLLILLSGVFCALDITLCKYVSGTVDPKRITQLVSFVGAIFVLCIMAVFQIPFQVDPVQLPSIAILGIFGTGIATFLFLTALKLIGTTRTVLLYSSNFAFGVIFAALFLHESVTIINLTSILFASIGIYLLRNKLGSIEKYINPVEKQTEKGSFKTLCQSCTHHGCCTSFTSPLLFPSDIERIKAIGKDDERYVTEIAIRGSKIKTLRKQENSTYCIFWDTNQKKCSIYKNRPFDCMIYPFDIFKIDGKYHWIVYTCNPQSNWEWSETYLHMFESNPQFHEILENIDVFSNLDEINKLKKLDKVQYTILRQVNFVNVQHLQN